MGKAKHRYILYLDETLRHLEQSTVHSGDGIGSEAAAKVVRVAQRRLLCGTICLKTSIMDGTAGNAPRRARQSPTYGLTAMRYDLQIRRESRFLACPPETEVIHWPRSTIEGVCFNGE